MRRCWRVCWWPSAVSYQYRLASLLPPESGSRGSFRPCCALIKNTDLFRRVVRDIGLSCVKYLRAEAGSYRLVVVAPHGPALTGARIA